MVIDILGSIYFGLLVLLVLLLYKAALSPQTNTAGVLSLSRSLGVWVDLLQ